jgi:hypothetical protein
VSSSAVPPKPELYNSCFLAKYIANASAARPSIVNTQTWPLSAVDVVVSGSELCPIGLTEKRMLRT